MIDQIFTPTSSDENDNNLDISLVPEKIRVINEKITKLKKRIIEKDWQDDHPHNVALSLQLAQQRLGRLKRRIIAEVK
jgi:hypothetical protein